MPKLVISEKGSDKEQVFEFSREGVTIGRSTENTLALTDKDISRKHARIIVEGNNYFLLDIGSGNGTLLNGSQIKQNENILLKNNDLISVGNHNLRFNQIDEMLVQSFNEVTDSDMLEVKLLKKVLRAIDRESIPSLEVLNGDFVGRKSFLSDDVEELVIGRDETADFQVEEYVISRRHAKVVRENGGFVIQDLNSKNGTYINNRRITSETIHDGDRIALGTIVLIFRNPKEVNMEAIKDAAKKARLTTPREEVQPESSEATGTGGEVFEGLEEIPSETPDDAYPPPRPKRQLISLSPIEIGMLGLGVFIMIFAVVSLVNLLVKS